MQRRTKRQNVSPRSHYRQAFFYTCKRLHSEHLLNHLSLPALLSFHTILDLVNLMSHILPHTHAFNHVVSTVIKGSAVHVPHNRVLTTSSIPFFLSRKQKKNLGSSKPFSLLPSPRETQRYVFKSSDPNLCI